MSQFTDSIRENTIQPYNLTQTSILERLLQDYIGHGDIERALKISSLLARPLTAFEMKQLTVSL